jgi:hypothetical protein
MNILNLLSQEGIPNLQPTPSNGSNFRKLDHRLMEQRTQFYGHLIDVGDQSTESIARAGAKVIYEMHLRSNFEQEAVAKQEGIRKPKPSLL